MHLGDVRLGHRVAFSGNVHERVSTNCVEFARSHDPLPGIGPDESHLGNLVNVSHGHRVSHIGERG